MPQTLIERAQQYVREGGTLPEEEGLILECIREGSAHALAAVQLLFEDDHGGITFNIELKAPAAYALAAWGHSGLDALAEAARRKPSSKNQSLCLQVLGTLATTAQPTAMLFCSPTIIAALSSALSTTSGITAYATRLLRDYVLSFTDDDEVAQVVGQQLFMSGILASNTPTAPPSRALFGALAMRWLSVSHPVISEFTKAIDSSPGDETVFQRLLGARPQLLDPLVMQVWPQPNIHGAKEPDFVIRRRDDTYLVVEIECPAKPILTDAGQLSHQTIHAVTQAQDYRSFLLDRIREMERHFPCLQEPDCLVVIGREDKLTNEQTLALRRSNRGYNRLQVVGFDWLVRRAEAVLRNLVENVAPIETMRIV